MLLDKKLEKRKEDNAYRFLKSNNNLIDFSSNDYLGLARSPLIRSALTKKWNSDDFDLGSTGSRLLTGNNERTVKLEQKIASYYQEKSALLFSSGYTANLGLLSTIPQKGELILYDQLVHASIRDGIRLSHAQSFSFRHNDLSHLEERLKKEQRLTYVVIESIYSMDGDRSNKNQVVALCKKYGAKLIVDEAHAVGIYGKKGEGVFNTGEYFAKVITFGKALGAHGAAVLGGEMLKAYLINFCRSFIYTTAMPAYVHYHFEVIYDQLPFLEKEKQQLNKNITIWQKFAPKYCCNCSNNKSPIQYVLVPGNEAVKQAAEIMLSEGIDVRPILSPTVEKGKERLRVSLHAYNTSQEMELLVQTIKKL